MKLLIVSDISDQQVNGITNTMRATEKTLRALGHEVRVVAPDNSRWCSLVYTFDRHGTLEFFAEQRLKKTLLEFEPDYIHIVTEGILGWAMRRVCKREGIPYSTAYHTRFDEYLEQRVPALFKQAARMLCRLWLEHAHGSAYAVLSPTEAMDTFLNQYGILKIKRWSRGVDTELYTPDRNGHPVYGKMQPPIWLYVGRIATEKNLKAFLQLDLPGTKVVVGEGPQKQEHAEKYPKARFLGKKSGSDLAQHYAQADFFVFPSKTDTFGLVLLEAAASGLRIIAYPVPSPTDVFADENATK